MTTAPRVMKLTPDLVALSRREIDPDERPAPNSTRGTLYQEHARKILSKLPDNGELWVFAYGSLIWKPAPEFDRSAVGAIRGWHRAFCLGWDRYYRGTREQPGLMMALDRGGRCEGVAFRIRAEGLESNLLELLRREPPIMPRWVTVRTANFAQRAIAFVNERKGSAYIGGLSDEQIADTLAAACGHLGSMAEYLANTVTQLEALGIHDRYLWKMQEMVADRLRHRGAG